MYLFKKWNQNVSFNKKNRSFGTDVTLGDVSIQYFSPLLDGMSEIVVHNGSVISNKHVIT